MLLWCLTASGAEPAPAPPALAPAPPPEHGILLTIDAYGNLLVGHVVVDTAKLSAQGVTLWTEASRHEGPSVPLVSGMRVLGLPQGERLVADGIDSLMYFDANSDRYLDALDPVFPLLTLFSDNNGDKRISSGELRTLSAIGVESISRYGEIRMKER